MLLKISENKTESFISNSQHTSISIIAKDTEPGAELILIIEKNDETYECIKLDDIIKDGNHIFSFDAVSYSVYNDAHSFRIEAKKAQLVEAIVTFEDEPELPSTFSQSFCENTIVGIDGFKYTLSISSDKEIIMIPHIPHKTLFVGNSLLLGMGFYGMCASSPSNDYAYYVSEEIKKYNPSAVFEKVHIGQLEHSATPDEFWKKWSEEPNIYTKAPCIDSFTDDLDLIILQLGDNINNQNKLKTFSQCGDEFIHKIKQRSPHARIILIDSWGNHSFTADVIYALCDRWHIPIVSIYDLCCKQYQAKSGMKYLTSNGDDAVVKDAWITHPGNLGMKCIADRIISKLDL